MPFDQTLADRIRPQLARRPGFAEKRMFGGLAFLLHGNMTVGVWKDFLIARVGPEAYEAALARRGAHEFDITGRPMQGWVMVDPGGARDELELADWIDQSVAFVASLPKKRAAKNPPKKKSPSPRAALKKPAPPKRRRAP